MSERPKKVLFPYVGDSIGGSHISSTLYVSNASEEVEPMVVIHEEDKLAPYLKARHIDYTLLPLPNYLGVSRSIIFQIFLALRIVPRLVRFIKKHKIDVVHTNDMRMHLTWSLACFHAGCKHVWHQRTVFPVSRLATHFFKRFATHVICLSQFIKDTLPSDGEKEVSIIPNPVESFDSINSEQQRQEVIGDADYIVGTFGNMREVKQPWLFAEMVNTLEEMLPGKVVYLICGEDRGGYEQSICSVVDANVRSRLIFKGFVIPVEPWIQACDVVVATSKSDGFGRTLIEAMALNSPVVAVNQGAHNEIITDNYNGLLVEPNAVALASGCYQILKDEKQRALLVEGAKKSIPRYSVTNYVKNIESVYERITG